MATEFKFELSGPAAAQLAEMARKMGVEPAQAIGRALATQAFFLEEKERGADVLLRKRDRSLLKVDL